MTRSARQGILALDVGLTAVKAAVIAQDGRFVAIARRFWPDATRPFDLERDLASVWPTVAEAARDALGGAPAGIRMVAIAPTTAAQMGVCLDAAGEPFVLPPAPPARPSRQRGRRHAPGSGYARVLVRTIRHARRWRPDLFDRIDRVGALHTYVLWRLGGNWNSDPATGPGGLRWPRRLETSSGLAETAFPHLLAQEAVSAPLSAAAAAALGLGAGLSVAVGGQDGACASFGAGAYHPGDCLLNLSTNFVPRLVTGRVVPGLFGYPIRPGAWAWVDGLPQSGRQLDLAARALSGAGAGPEAIDRLADAALDLLRRGESGPRLGYLAPPAVPGQAARVGRLVAAGERPERVYLGVVEGLAEALSARVREGEAWGVRPERYVVTGGLSRQAVLTAVLARSLGAPLEQADPEAGVLGAAALATPAAGWFPTPEAALAAWRRGTGGSA